MIQVKEETKIGEALSQNTQEDKSEIRPFIPYRDFYIYENTRMELFNTDEEENKSPIKILGSELFVDNLYTHVLYPNLMGRDLYLQKIINQTDPEEYIYPGLEDKKAYISYIDFETTVKQEIIETGKMSLVCIEPNIIEFKILERITNEEIKKSYSHLIYLLRLVEYVTIQDALDNKI